EMGADPAEAEAWLSGAAAQGRTEAQQLLPEPQAARQVAHENCRIREAERKYWGHWYLSAPYYCYWHDRSWYQRCCNYSTSVPILPSAERVRMFTSTLPIITRAPALAIAGSGTPGGWLISSDNKATPAAGPAGGACRVNANSSPG